MTTPALTTGADEPLTAAARTMARHDVRRLCVVDGTGAFVGRGPARPIRTFLRDDDAIRADLEDHVSTKGMWLFPGSLTVEVTHGGGHRGRCGGAPEHRPGRRAADPGRPRVVAVRNNVRYELDDTVTSAR